MASASSSGRDFFNFLMLERGFHHAQDAESQLVLGLHRLDEVFLDPFDGRRHVAIHP